VSAGAGVTLSVFAILLSTLNLSSATNLCVSVHIYTHIYLHNILLDIYILGQNLYL